MEKRDQSSSAQSSRKVKNQFTLLFYWQILTPNLKDAWIWTSSIICNEAFDDIMKDHIQLKKIYLKVSNRLVGSHPMLTCWCKLTNYFCGSTRNCTQGNSDRKVGGSMSEGSMAGRAMSMSSVENGMLQSTYNN